MVYELGKTAEQRTRSKYRGFPRCILRKLRERQRVVNVIYAELLLEFRKFGLQRAGELRR